VFGDFSQEATRYILQAKRWGLEKINTAYNDKFSWSVQQNQHWT